MVIFMLLDNPLQTIATVASFVPFDPFPGPRRLGNADWIEDVIDFSFSGVRRVILKSMLLMTGMLKHVEIHMYYV